MKSLLPYHLAATDVRFYGDDLPRLLQALGFNRHGGGLMLALALGERRVWEHACEA